jgi:hypothetical protein
MSGTIKTLRPCDCEDRETARLLNEQGIGTDTETITVLPAYVELRLGPTTIKISQHRFKQFAEWYLKPQEIKDKSTFGWHVWNAAQSLPE